MAVIPYSGQDVRFRLQIFDALGNITLPGMALPLIDILPGDQQLNYSLRLVATYHAVKSGDSFSSIRFNLDYS